MTHSLPKKPDLTHLKKQARKLLKHFRNTAKQNQHQQALAFVQQYHPKPETFSGLRDAQLVVARSYDFGDWQELTQSVAIALFKLESFEEQVTAFIKLACVQYAGNDAVILYRRANRLLAQNAELASSDFYAALVANNAEAVATFLEQNSALARQSGGPLKWPALLYVTYSRIEDNSDEPQAIKVAQLLLDYGADPNSFVVLNDNYRFTALTGAMGEGEGGEVHQPTHQYASELARLLLNAGASPNEGQGLYNTVFANNSIYWLKLLMEYGLQAQHKVNWKQEIDDDQGIFDFLLAYAVKNGFEERVSFLLEHGANPNVIDPYDKRPLYGLALIMGFPSIASKLVEYGARADTLSTDDKLKQAIASKDIANVDEIISDQPILLGNTEFIHHAARRSDLATVIHLISLGFDVNGITDDGRSLLHVYAWEDDEEAVTALLDAGANIDSRDKAHQSTALGHALYSRATNTMEYLLNRSNSIIDVVCCAHLGRLKTLLETNPDQLHTRTPRGNTLMHIIGFQLDGELADHRYSDIIDYLTALGLDINIRNNEGSTPLDFAGEISNEQFAELLIERGGVSSSPQS